MNPFYLTRTHEDSTGLPSRLRNCFLGILVTNLDTTFCIVEKLLILFSFQILHLKMQLDNETRSLSAARDENIQLKAQVEALDLKIAKLKAKVSLYLFIFNELLSRRSKRGGVWGAKSGRKNCLLRWLVFNLAF